MKNEFMGQWDGIRTQGGRGGTRVLVLAATNRPFDLDEVWLVYRFGLLDSPMAGCWQPTPSPPQPPPSHPTPPHPHPRQLRDVTMCRSQWSV